MGSQENAKRKIILFAIISVIALLIFTSFYLFSSNDSDVLRVGYINTWAESSLPIEVMKNTQIVEENDIDVEFFSFPSGAPITEAALSNSLDVGFVGRVPALKLLSESEDWFIAARLAYFPIEILAKTDSRIDSLADLKGKRIGVPFATGPYALIIKILEEEGLDPEKDVTLVNIKPQDMGIALQTNQVDAISWGEPLLSTLKQKNLAYTIEEIEEVGFVIISKSYAKESPEELRRFLESYQESFLYISENRETVFVWFSEDSQYDLNIIESLKFIEPNYGARSIEDIDVEISNEWFVRSQERADLEYELGIYDKNVDVRKGIDFSFTS